MKVLYIAHSSGLQGSGIALLNILSQLRHEIEPVVVLPSRGEMCARLASLGIRYHILSTFHNFLLPPRYTPYDYVKFIPKLARTLVKNFIAKKQLERIVKAEKPDVIHTNTSVSPFGYDVAKKHSIPHVWHIREYLNESKQNKFFYIFGYNYFRRRLFSSSNYPIAITQGVFAYFDLDPHKARVIYDGVFSESQQEIPKKNTEKYILFAGTVARGKGAFEAIDAFAALAEELGDYKLLLAGIYTPEAKAHINKLPCKDRIVLLGFRNDVYELMANAAALIVPSYNEGFGFIVAEAMLNRCLVIGRNVAGIKEQFDNGVKLANREIGVRFTDFEELKKAIVSSLQIEDSARTQMIEAAHSTVCRLYTSERSAAEVLGLYKSITKSKIK